MNAELGSSWRPRGIAEANLERLNAGAITDKQEISRLLEAAQQSSAKLVGRRTLRGAAESATIKRVGANKLLLRCSQIEVGERQTHFFTFGIGGRSYFFAASHLSQTKGELIEFALPAVIYLRDRRDHPRVDHPRHRVTLQNNAGQRLEGFLENQSAAGMRVRLQDKDVPDLKPCLRVSFLEGSLAGDRCWAQPRNMQPHPEYTGWHQVGFATSAVPYEDPLRVERRGRILQLHGGERVRQGVAIVSAGARLALSRRAQITSSSAEIEVVHFENEAREEICGILDRSKSASGGIGVLIPPAWGRTKETLLPLAASIVSTFERAGESVVVLRFDGVRRRGESHNDPECLIPGKEYHHFTISQAVDDIRTAARYLKAETGIERVVLVTFSAASIEGRRAVVEDDGSDISAWISVVGASDLQSGMRTVSGGIDYFGGADQGIGFGFQEIMGVNTDIDRLASDALEKRLVFLEDARRDMSQIRIPVTWIHGSNDAWLDLARVREIMGCGDRSQRKLMEVPTGHQLKNSREALAVFGLVAEEIARLSISRRVRSSLPDLVQLKQRGTQERSRLSSTVVRLREFWKDYLLGRKGRLGIEMMNATRAYREFMRLQVDGLALRGGEHILDLGAGAGAFPAYIIDSGARPNNLVIDEVDFVAEALERSKSRMAERGAAGIQLNYLLCDLDDRESVRQLVRTETYDAVLASLLLSYVRRPEEVLDEVHRSLRKSGRLVVSSLRRDADFSKLYLDGIEELRAGGAREAFGPDGERDFSLAAGEFLNDAARVLDFEEAGIFRFWDSDELAGAIEDAGFAVVSVGNGFGAPPQAVVVCAERR